MRVGDRTERIGELLYSEAPAVPEKREDVVPQLHAGMLRSVSIPEPDEALSLLAIHRLEALSGLERLARFHLDDHDRLSAPSDEIDLAVTRAEIALDDRIPAQPIEPGCPTLTTAAEIA